MHIHFKWLCIKYGFQFAHCHENNLSSVNFCGPFIIIILSNGMINVANTGKTSFMPIHKKYHFTAHIFRTLSCDQQLSVKTSCTKFLGNLIWCTCWYYWCMDWQLCSLSWAIFFTLRRYVKLFWHGYDSNFPCVANFCMPECKLYIFHILLFSDFSDTFNAFQCLLFSPFPLFPLQ